MADPKWLRNKKNGDLHPYSPKRLESRPELWEPYFGVVEKPKPRDPATVSMPVEPESETATVMEEANVVDQPPSEPEQPLVITERMQKIIDAVLSSDDDKWIPAQFGKPSYPALGHLAELTGFTVKQHEALAAVQHIESGKE